MSYTLFILLCLGVSYSLSTEMITLSLREWVMKHSKFFGDLIFCPVCTSMWVGTTLGIFFTPIFPLLDGFIVLAIMKIIEKISLIG